MLRVPLVTILTREMRLKFFEVDQRFEMLRVPLVTILAREMRLKVFQLYLVPNCQYRDKPRSENLFKVR